MFLASASRKPIESRIGVLSSREVTSSMSAGRELDIRSFTSCAISSHMGEEETTNVLYVFSEAFAIFKSEISTLENICMQDFDFSTSPQK